MNAVRATSSWLRQIVFGLVVVIDIPLVAWGAYETFTLYARGYLGAQMVVVGLILGIFALGVASGLLPNKPSRIGVVLLRLAMVVVLAGLFKEIIANFLPTTIVLIALALLSPGRAREGKGAA